MNLNSIQHHASTLLKIGIATALLSGCLQLRPVQMVYRKAYVVCAAKTLRVRII